jgi:hypothetical protein
MNIVKLSGINYKLGKLDAFKQFHVSRRLAPFYVALLESAKALRASLPADFDIETSKDELDFVALASSPIIEVIATMPDADVDYILKTCMAVVSIEQSEGIYAPLMTSAGMLMFADLSMPTMIGLTIAVVRQDLASFFPTGQTTSQ